MLADGRPARPVEREQAIHFRTRMSAAGFTLAGADHAIIPVMLGMPSWPPRWRAACWRLASTWWASFLPRGPQGQARIRTQMSAAHTREQLDKAIDAFIRIGRELGVI